VILLRKEVIQPHLPVRLPCSGVPHVAMGPGPYLHPGCEFAASATRRSRICVCFLGCHDPTMRMKRWCDPART